MKKIFLMAFKDLRLISRDRLGAFFIVFFPILMGLFFGLMMGGPSGSGGGSKMRIAVIDEDNSDISGRFIASLTANSSLAIETDTLDAASESVRLGKRVGLIRVPAGFGERAGMFWGDPPDIHIGLDPSRKAEAAMLEGFVMQSIGELIGERFQNPSQFKPMIERSRKELAESDASDLQKGIVNTFFNSMDSMLDSAEKLASGEGNSSGTAMGQRMQFANIVPVDISKKVDPNSQAGQLLKLRSTWDISFPQAMLWGVLGCIASFAISIARENSMGTMLRLRVAPVSSSEVLAGKALACFLTAVGVIVMMTIIGVLMGMKPASYPKLAVASVCIATGFTGVMMVISLLGRTEQSVSGAGWAINMIMAMLGGCMIPAMFMPAAIRNFSVLSPVRWAILSLEGAIWREFTWYEMATPLLVMLAVGGVCFVIGSLMFQRRTV